MKKKITLFFLVLPALIFAQQPQLPSYSDSIFPTYYWQRVTHFNTLPQSKDDIIFLGNSITDGAERSELFNDIDIKNRGISGDVTAGVIHRLDGITKGHPSKIFLLIGINDLGRNISPDSVVKNILIISSYIKYESPSTKLFVQSILPVNDTYHKFSTHTNKVKEIKQVNEQLLQYANQYQYTFINLYSSFCDENEKLKSDLTNDGLHLKGEAYLLWKRIVYPYIYGHLPPKN
jgi:lysophospholipase L1-like esterase